MTQYTPEQIAANQAKWLAALRSGKYQQSTQVLRGAEGFCCLGVLCDVIDPTRWSGQVYDRGAIGFPPPDILASVGMPHQRAGNINGESIYNNLTTRVAHMNDRGSSFTEIADLLEQEFSK